MAKYTTTLIMALILLGTSATTLALQNPCARHDTFWPESSELPADVPFLHWSGEVDGEPTFELVQVRDDGSKQIQKVADPSGKGALPVAGLLEPGLDYELRVTGRWCGNPFQSTKAYRVIDSMPTGLTELQPPLFMRHELSCEKDDIDVRSVEITLEDAALEGSFYERYALLSLTTDPAPSEAVRLAETHVGEGASTLILHVDCPGTPDRISADALEPGVYEVQVRASIMDGFRTIDSPPLTLDLRCDQFEGVGSSAESVYATNYCRYVDFRAPGGAFPILDPSTENDASSGGGCSVRSGRQNQAAGIRVPFLVFILLVHRRHKIRIEDRSTSQRLRV